tara:strand:- start:720 stop:1484 length:765 start_codon:yes stop_codon:yes gene_type:complete
MALSKTINNEKNEIIWSVSPEVVRLYAYSCFWVLVIVGAILTFNFADVDFQDNPLINMFGYNNICILFDSFPATYFLPMLWSVNFLLLFSYITLSWYRVYQMYLFDNYPKSNFTIFSTFSIFEYIGLIFFSGVFAANPNHEGMFLHTIPFTFLIFALSLMGIKNYLFYRYIAKLSNFEKNLGLLYVIVHLSVSFIKMTMQLNALFDDAFYTTLNFIALNQFIDRFWMATAVLFPIYFSFKFRKRVPSIEFKSSF